MSSIKAIVTLALIIALSLVSIGCSDSDVTAPVAEAPVVDTAPPAVPTNLNANYSDGQISLSWAQNTTDADLAGFIVRRDNYGEVTTLVASPSIIQNYSDTPAMGLNIYQVFSVDLVGNESAIATVEYHLIGSHDRVGINIHN